MSLLRIVEDARTHNRTQNQRQFAGVHGRIPTTPTMTGYQNESEPLLPSNTEDENHVIGNRNCYRCCCANCCCKFGSIIGAKLYRSIKRVLDTVQEQSSLMWIVVFTLFGVSAVCKFIGGAAKLTSDCPLEHLVAIYLFAKGCLAFFFWVPWIFMLVTGQTNRAWQNTFVVAFTIFDAIATCGLQIFGTVVAIGYYGTMKESCPIYVKQWNDNLANLALGLTAFDWLGVAVFLYCSCFIACKTQHNADYY